MGRVARRFGLACDNLQSVDIVTADGKLLTASDAQNPDLFWALRGGAANYGANYLRLQRIKRQYDPANQFRLNANVLPA